MPTLSEMLRLPIALPGQAVKDLSSLADAVGQLPQMITGLTSLLREMSGDVSQLRETANAMHLHLANLGTDITALGATVDRADARVGHLEAMVGEMQGRVDHIDDGLDTRFGHVERMVEELRGRVAHIDDGLDDRVPDLSPLPDEVTRIRRDIAKVLEMTPDPNEPGTLEKMREALTPGD